MFSASKKNLLCIILIAAILSAALPAMAGPGFPIFPVIESNVNFWEKVYSTYSTRQGILHDKEDLDIIYTVVNLVDWNTPGAARINKQLVKIARQRYKNILSSLAEGNTPTSKDEIRIAALFKKNRHPSFRRARDNIRLQIGQKDRFLKGFIRSGAYISSIKRILRAKGLPAELAYLPHVESSFNPKAYSKVAAAGLWQFTRATGRQYLTINDVIDERLDVYLSTQAASQFLRENYRQLGSWPLALTAYNYGRAGMVRASEQLGSYEKIFTSHNSRIFKFASKNFYSEFLAALRVAKKLEKKPKIIQDRPRASATMRLKGFAKASALRKYFKVSQQDFALLNPALRPPVLKGKKYAPKGYLLRLPATQYIRKKMKTVPASLFHRRQTRQTRTLFYKVRRGDTVSSIARKHHVRQKDLIRANHLNRKRTIHPGQKLRIPANGRLVTSSGSKTIRTLKATAKRRP